MKKIKSLYNSNSKLLIFISCTVSIVMVLMIFYGLETNKNPYINILLWLFYGLSTTLVIFLLRNIIFSSQKNDIKYILLSYLIGYIFIVFLVHITTLEFPFAKKILDISLIYIAVCVLSEIISYSVSKKNSPKNITPKIMYKLTLPQRSRLIFIKADGHYVKVATEKGSYMIYLSFKEAIKLTEPIEGEVIHRSFWVVKDAIKNIIRQNGKVYCIMNNDERIPVGRSKMEFLKNKKWF